MLFRFSLLMAGIMGMIVGNVRNDAQGIADVLDMPLGSIEKAYADDGAGDCCGGGCGDGAVAFPAAGVGVGVQFENPD